MSRRVYKRHPRINATPNRKNARLFEDNKKISVQLGNLHLPDINDSISILSQVALGRGNRAEFNHLKNLVNRERKKCRAKYYACKVQHLLLLKGKL